MRYSIAIFLAALGVPLAIACGTDATGIETCKKIEEARCRRAPACADAGVSLANPVHIGDDVSACIRYYDDACLHGLTGSDTSAARINECVNAIDSDCTFVGAPELSPACQWLLPSPVPDAGPEAGDSAADASADATSE